MENTLKDVFTPLSVVKPNVRKSILWFHIVVFILSWTFLVPEHSFFPNLGEVLTAWKGLWMNGLAFQIIKTLILCSIATAISIIVSGAIAYGSTIPFFTPISYFFTRLRYNPIQGFTLFLTIMSGGGRSLQVLLLVIFMSFYFITGLMSMIRDIPEEDFIRRQAQKMTKWQILWNVVIVDRLDCLVEVIRQNLSMTFMMIVSVEAMDKSQGGLGALLVDSDHGIAFPRIFALQLNILLLGILIDLLLKAAFNSFPVNKKNS